MQARRHSLARYLPSSVDLYTHFRIERDYTTSMFIVADELRAD